MSKRGVLRLIRQIAAFLLRPILPLVALMVRVVYPGNEAYPIFAAHGFHLLRKHYYLPIPEESDLAFTRESALVGLDLNEQAALALIDDLLAPYKAEFSAFPRHPGADPHGFHLINGTFMAIDGNVYYALIRRHQPRRLIEIGSGASTLLAAAAIRRNVAEGGRATELVCIEPFPPAPLRTLPELSCLITQKVQAVDLATFEALSAGDILFIDSTHVLRSGGDVWWEYCEILPRLASGVLVHVHDISLPKPYPRVYFDSHFYWNEQYLLQAFLAFNSHFEVIWPGNYLMTRYPERMASAFSPEYDQMRAAFPSSEPTSFWMRVR